MLSEIETLRKDLEDGREAAGELIMFLRNNIADNSTDEDGNVVITTSDPYAESLVQLLKSVEDWAFPSGFNKIKP